ncbi:unnamed protein product (macronuclear) [Paramecium tetraurelia]|uniref:Uncharacterized protein n=1 Tax=Paramecium tetraurelia TaxID=5888 RepID=A0BZY7_PARTE|nr:uncharacterized protein GSPATT00005956001 [Paramecium tetraurelia]CAK64104.1 unnamed protein product [Paramecium tetraurelia]|eukprot:XP_001431502.1 hypothetical protein (macronuclear) [Paramecium tetraurelia strain d4-2]
MDSDFYKEIKDIIDLIYQQIAISRNKSLISKLNERKEQIYASIPQAQSKILLNQQNREFITKYLDKFAQFVSNQDNLVEQGFFKLIRQSQKSKLQNIFAKKFTQLPQYFKNLESQDISATGFINSQDVAHSKIPVNFTASSFLLDNDIDYVACITLIFKDICDEEIFIHSLSTQKLLKKIPELNQFEYLKILKNYLTITVDQQQNIITLEPLDPIIQYSPLFKINQNEKQQEFYLSKEMEIILSPTYKIKVVDIFNKENKALNDNFITKNLINQYDNTLLIKNAENYIILQPQEQNIKHEPIIIFDLKGSILLNKVLKLQKEISVKLIHDGVGFLFEELTERSNFYTSLSYQSPVYSKTKKINLCLVVKNQLRIQIDSECGQLFFDTNEYNRNLFD